MRTLLTAAIMTAAAFSASAATTLPSVEGGYAIDQEYEPFVPPYDQSYFPGGGLWRIGLYDEWAVERYEFDLTGLTAADIGTATISFVYDGAQGSQQQSSYLQDITGGLNMRLYQGDNVITPKDIGEDVYLNWTDPGSAPYTFNDGDIGKTFSYTVTSEVSQLVGAGIPALGWAIQGSYLPESYATEGISDVTLTIAQPVPEPSTIALMVVGLGIIAAGKRRRVV